MRLDEISAVLARAPLFAGMGEEPLRLLAFSAERIRRTEGQKLFSRDAPAFTALVVAAGEVSLLDEAGEETMRVGPPAVLSERALITDAVRPATAIMASAGVVVEIPRLLMRRVLEEYPQTLAHVQAHFAYQLDAQLRELEAAGAELDRL